MKFPVQENSGEDYQLYPQRPDYSTSPNVIDSVYRAYGVTNLLNSPDAAARTVGT